MTIPIHLRQFFALLAVSLLIAAYSASGSSAALASGEGQEGKPGLAPTAPVLAGARYVAGQAVEGGLIVAQADAASRISLDGEPVEMDSKGYFLIGFHRDSDRSAILEIRDSRGRRHRTLLAVGQREYEVQRIDGLRPDHVSPPRDVLARIRADSAQVRRARTNPDAGMAAGDFLAGFDMPVTGRITGVYGSQRILNGEPRAPHYGIDIAAQRGTPVLAPAGGRITLVRDLYFSGWTVLMSHGLGLNSAFLHLGETDVVEGQEVVRGEVIGTVGSSGRSTGPHLDWRLDWQGRRLDAALVRDLLAAGGTGR